MKNPLTYLILGWVWLITVSVGVIWTPEISKYTFVSMIFFAISIAIIHRKNKIPVTKWLGLAYFLLFGGYLLGQFTDDKVLETISMLSCIAGMFLIFFKRD